MLQNFRSFVDDPVPDLGAGNSSIGGRADRPSSIVAPEPESANNNSAKKKSATSSAAAAPARAGRSARRSHRRCGSPRARALGQPLWVIWPNTGDRSVRRPPLRCASESKRPFCQCCRISDHLSMTRYLISAPATAASAVAPIARAPSSPPNQNSANNNSAKKKSATSSTAAAPARAGRSARRSHRRCGSPRARALGQPLWVIWPNTRDRSVRRPPLRCASESKRPFCQCCRISDHLSMTRYLISAPATAASAVAPIARAPSSPPNQNLRTTIPLKRSRRRRQPPLHRLEPVGLLGAATADAGRLARAR